MKIVLMRKEPFEVITLINAVSISVSGTNYVIVTSSGSTSYPIDAYKIMIV